MGWHINEVKNTVTFTRSQAVELIARGGNFLDHIYDDNEGEIREAFFGYGELKDEGNKLFFDYDHMEHMDYLTGREELCKIVATLGVKGDVCFASEEGDNASTAWGVRFLGDGTYKRLVGRRTFEVL